MPLQVRKNALDKMERAMGSHYNNRAANRYLTSVQLFDDSKMPATRFHIVFCLDESGSMSGQKWQEVLTAYQQLLSRRRSDQSEEDLVSVVTFNSTASTVCEAVPLTNAPSSFTYRGGGTSFAPALQVAHQLHANQPSDCTPLLIFMSDGDNSDSGPTMLAMQQLVAAYGGRTNLQVHTIGFQAGSAGDATLKQMAAVAPGGQFHSCQSGVDLSRTFVSIAAGSTAVDGLVQRFGEILSEQISLKIMHDYL